MFIHVVLIHFSWYCKASLVCIWLFWSVNQKRKNNVYGDTHRYVTYCYWCPNQRSIDYWDKGFFCFTWENVNNKTNYSSMFVNSEYSYYAVSQWWTPLRFSQLLFYCQVYARKTICLFVLSVYVFQNLNNEQNHVTVDTLPHVIPRPWEK